VPRVKVGDRYIDFPDGTPPEEIQAVLNDQFSRARQLGEYLSRPEFGTSFPINRWDEQGQTALDIAAIITSVVPGLGTATDMAALADHERRGDDVKWWEWALSTVGLGVEAGALHGIFAGVKSAKADLARLSKAQDMQGQGVDRAKIWEDTGWFQDVDGHWKYEIDDSAATYKDPSYLKFYGEKLDELGYRVGAPDTPDSVREIAQSYANQKLESTRLKDGLDHPELYEHYPSDGMGGGLPNTKFEAGVVREGYAGAYIPEENKISISARQIGDYTDPKSTPLHETQHAIQEIEGFARGGSPNDFSLGASTDLMNAHQDIYKTLTSDVAERMQSARGDFQSLIKIKKQNPEEYEKVSELLRQAGVSDVDEARAYFSRVETEELKRLEPREQYRRLAGEAEARNVQARMNMPVSGRRIIPPWETLDVPEKDLIVKK
jgi:hypothetical protein